VNLTTMDVARLTGAVSHRRDDPRLPRYLPTASRMDLATKVALPAAASPVVASSVAAVLVAAVLVPVVALREETVAARPEHSAAA
jgi:hypothetical protein